MPLPLTVSCFSKIQIGFIFLVPAHPGSPGQRAVKRVCVCVYSLNNVRIPSSTLSNLSNSSLADCDAHLSQKTKFQCEQEIWFARQFFIAASEIGGPAWLNMSNMSEAKPVSILPQNHNFKSNEQQKTLHTRTKLNTPYTLHWPANQTSWIAELFTILQ